MTDAMTHEQALAIIALIDERVARADETCDYPGITLSEAARRMLIEDGHPAFAEVALFAGVPS